MADYRVADAQAVLARNGILVEIEYPYEWCSGDVYIQCPDGSRVGFHPDHDDSLIYYSVEQPDA